MLQSITQLYGSKLAALDGQIGHVKDFYFDDQSWAIRYLVAETGIWLPGRQVLISPHAIGSLDGNTDLLHVDLSLTRIEDSPPIEAHIPVSRQHEEDHYQYYGWPGYWLGDSLWGMSCVPTIDLPDETRARTSERHPRDDAHLRSTRAVDGYHLQTTTGKIGRVYDYMVNPQSWAVRQLIIKTDHWLSSKEVEIPAMKVDRISYEESTVFVNMTREAVQKSPAHQLVTRPALH